MPLSLLPRVVVSRLTDVTPAMLRELGVRALLLDFDNTIVPYTTDAPTEAMARWLQELPEAGIFLAVVSNSRKDRVVRFCRAAGLSCITHSRKPFQKGIGQAMARFQLEPSTTALAGDQIFTDVLGANCGGLTSILVTPIHLHNVWLKLRYGLETALPAAGPGTAAIIVAANRLLFPSSPLHFSTKSDMINVSSESMV